MDRRRRTVLAALGVAAVVASGVGIVSAATAKTACDVTYTVSSQWPGGFSTNVRVRNTGSGTIQGWSLRWTFSGGQRVIQGWSGTYVQKASEVTVTAASWNSGVAAGGAVNTGFVGTYSGRNPAPTQFTLNGVTCTVGGRPAPNPQPTTTGPAPPTTGPTSTPTSTATGTRPPTTTPTAPTPTATGSGSTTTPPAPTTQPTPTTTAPTGGSGGPALGAGRIQYGPVYTGEGTFYGATGEGNCSYEASSDRMIAAMNELDYENSQACGAYVAVTGPTGNTVTVKVVDRCPECRPGDIDLSAEAFAKLANPSAGRIKISWKLVSPAVSGPVAYKYKDGSSQWWCAVQVRNHRNPVLRLEVLVGGSWKQLTRQTYNYFLSADGSGCGSTIRITDIYGHQLVDSGITLSPTLVQQGKSQFGAPS